MIALTALFASLIVSAGVNAQAAAGATAAPASGGSKSPVVAILQPDAAQVSGTIYFFQPDPNGPVTVTGQLSGLDPNAERGIHIHQFGDLTNNCTSTGEHWNPTNTTHGSITNPLTTRHRGDLGNFLTDANGDATLNITDVVGGLSLYGEDNIVGRAIVVHTGTDDLGLGGNEGSLKNGNSGGRAGCGVIGFSNLTTFGVVPAA